jgi:hypothetical protein
MAWGRTKTEHSGPKRGKGQWGRKAAAKEVSKRSRRREDGLASSSESQEEIGRTTAST